MANALQIKCRHQRRVSGRRSQNFDKPERMYPLMTFLVRSPSKPIGILSSKRRKGGSDTKISLHLDKKPIKDALRHLLESEGLTAEFKDGVLSIHDKESPDADAEVNIGDIKMKIRKGAPLQSGG